jgi:hypothetical protein
LLAIAHLKRRKKLRLPAIRRRLARMSPAEIALLAGRSAPTQQGPLPAGGNAPQGTSGGVAAASASGFGPRGGPYRPDLARPLERWERVAICPGVDLLVRVDVDTEARRVATEIETLYAIPPAVDRASVPDNTKR